METSSTSSLEITPLLLAAGAGIGLLLVGVGIVSLVRGQRSGSHGAKRDRHQHLSVELLPEAPGTPNANQFCTQCGQPLLSGDRFCRQCGAPVRQ